MTDKIQATLCCATQMLKHTSRYLLFNIQMNTLMSVDKIFFQLLNLKDVLGTLKVECSQFLTCGCICTKRLFATIIITEDYLQNYESIKTVYKYKSLTKVTKNAQLDGLGHTGLIVVLGLKEICHTDIYRQCSMAHYTWLKPRQEGALGLPCLLAKLAFLHLQTWPQEL